MSSAGKAPSLTTLLVSQGLVLGLYSPTCLVIATRGAVVPCREMSLSVEASHQTYLLFSKKKKKREG